jgi:hypothetical protein
MNPITQDDEEEEVHNSTALEGLLLAPFYVTQHCHVLFFSPIKWHSEFQSIRLADTLFFFLKNLTSRVFLNGSVFPQ